jgi:hypothetical protein
LSAGDVQAFRWTPARGYETLGTPGTSAFFGASAVSYDGSVIVGEHPPETGYAAFRWTAGTGMVQLPINIAAAVTPDGGMVAGGDNSGGRPQGRPAPSAPSPASKTRPKRTAWPGRRRRRSRSAGPSRVLAAGGETQNSRGQFSTTASAELYTP